MNETVHPILVHNTDTGMIEAFIHTSRGNHDGVWGCRNQKAIINPANLTVNVEDLGVQPWGYGTYAVAAPTQAQHNTGFYKNGKYYLPVSHIFEGDNIFPVSNADYTSGIVLDGDANALEKWIPFRLSAGFNCQYVDTDIGPMLSNVTNRHSPYVFSSQVMSYVNLASPVNKPEDNILRVLYAFRMA
jgi:hypothetical protein